MRYLSHPSPSLFLHFLSRISPSHSSTDFLLSPSPTPIYRNSEPQIQPPGTPLLLHDTTSRTAWLRLHRFIDSHV
ncbi:hypothetical protein BJV78DRAFT_171548 [Lactifluus subvellereus]|nr:hypothetical protein BJV78DRAFT_171548 [Lactifluus subvellereus]